MLDDHSRKPSGSTPVISGHYILTWQELSLTGTLAVVGFLACLMIGHFLFTLRMKEMQSCA